MSYQNNLQSYYEKRIETMIAPLIGDNNVNVRVQATLDFTQNEEADEKYDPQQSVIRSEETESETDSGSGASGAPGSLSNSPDEAGASKSQASAAGPSSASGKTQSVKNYEVSKTVSYRKSISPRLINLSAAVVVDGVSTLDPKTNKYVKKELDKATIDKITELVKTTIGYDDKRGDKVTVINSAFNGVEPVTDGYKQSFWQQPWFWDMVKKTITILVSLFVLFFSIKKLLTYIKSSNKHATAGAHNSIGTDSGSAVTSEMMQLKQEQINRLKELASRDPNRVSVIIKNWVEK